MCNHFRWDDPKKVLEEAGLVADENEVRLAEVQTEFWPKYPVPVVVQAERRTLTTMRWGVWPFYESTMPSRLPNDARDDSLFTKSIWKGPVAKGRCLVPADTFFEWAGPPRGKWEVMFQRLDKGPFFIGGVWSRDPAGDGRGFAIVTTKPNALLAAVPHERMPLILDRPSALVWIGNTPVAQEQILALCQPYPADGMMRKDLPKAPRQSAKLEVEPVKQGELF